MHTKVFNVKLSEENALADNEEAQAHDELTKSLVSASASAFTSSSDSSLTSASVPLMSVVVPVYNGNKKIESTLQKLESQVAKLYPLVAKLVVQGERAALALVVDAEEPKKPLVYTGRKVLEAASAGILLDEYLSKDPAHVPAEFLSIEPNAAYKSRRGLSSHQESEGKHLDKQEKDDQEINGEHVVSIIHPRSSQSILVDRPASVSSWYEIIVVNDGSKDDTKKIVEKLISSSANDRIRLISYSINMGKGYAIKQGVIHSQGKYVMFMDGDGDIGTEVLSNYLEQMADSDIVIGSKYHRLSLVNTPGSRKFLSKGFQLFVKLMLGLKVSDTQVGLKAGRGDMFRKIFEKVIVKRYAFDAEMLAIAGLLNLKVTELPVKIDIEKSFKKKEMAKMAIDVLGIAFRLRIIRWYQRNMESQRPYYRPHRMFA